MNNYNFYISTYLRTQTGQTACMPASMNPNQHRCVEVLQVDVDGHAYTYVFSVCNRACLATYWPILSINQCADWTESVCTYQCEIWVCLAGGQQLWVYLYMLYK